MRGSVRNILTSYVFLMTIRVWVTIFIMLSKLVIIGALVFSSVLDTTSLAPGLSSTVGITANSYATSDVTLGKRSTALDVLKSLNSASRLAPYVARGRDDVGVAVVTGGNSGIGAVSVETLAVSGMKVVLCSRSLESGEAIRSSFPDWCRRNVRVQKLDLADLGSVQDAANEIRRTEGTVHVLLNNAGVMATPKRMETKQGFELQIGTNHVGHHMFTRLLLPSMSSDGRVVTVASEAHRMARINFEDINFEESNSYSPWGAYGQSKLANILFAKELNDQLKQQGSKILSVSLHPGVIASNLWRYSTPTFIRGLLLSLISNKSLEQGAATSVYASLVEPNEFNGGEYLDDCAVAEPSSIGKDSNRTNRRKLWDKTEAMIHNAGYKLPASLL